MYHRLEAQDQTKNVKIRKNKANIDVKDHEVSFIYSKSHHIQQILSLRSSNQENESFISKQEKRKITGPSKLNNTPYIIQNNQIDQGTISNSKLNQENITISAKVNQTAQELVFKGTTGARYRRLIGILAKQVVHESIKLGIKVYLYKKKRNEKSKVIYHYCQKWYLRFKLKQNLFATCIQSNFKRYKQQEKYREMIYNRKNQAALTVSHTSK